MSTQIRRYRQVPVFAALGGLLLAAGAVAGDAQSSWDNEMQMMDANHDGKISAAEHAAGAKKMFQMMDTDKDGKVSAAEMDAGQAKMKGGKAAHEMSSAEKINAVDVNGDGVLTAAEHEGASQGMFEKMDADHDGNLTLAEIKSGHQKMMSKQ